MQAFHPLGASVDLPGAMMTYLINSTDSTQSPKVKQCSCSKRHMVVLEGGLNQSVRGEDEKWHEEEERMKW